MKKRVVVGMSGGVDSSVSAALLKEQGYDVIGAFALGWMGDKDFPCSWQEEEADARAVAEKLDIPFYTVNLSKEYEKAVINDFFRVYQAGGTPNPDILCNKEIKFKAMWQAVRQFEPDFIATGHYAQITNPGTAEAAIIKGVDPDKDQTYFLWAIDKEMLPKILFPIGHLQKKEVRELAKKYDLPTATKKDSQGICFVGPLKVRVLLKKYVKAKSGDVVLADGRKIATHDGVQFYTIGQRLGAGSVEWTGDVPPLFVAAKDVKNNVVVVGTDEQVHATELEAGHLNVISKEVVMPLKCKAKVRYRQEDMIASVDMQEQKIRVIFDEPVRAITPGQSVVFYSDNDELIGGAIIGKVSEQEKILQKLHATNSDKAIT
jgi:tRNA-specific 2-thiouridylase